MLSGSIYFRSRKKNVKLNNHLLTFLSIITSILLFNSVGANFCRYHQPQLLRCFKCIVSLTIIAQFAPDLFYFVWNPLNLKLLQQPYCSRSSNLLTFNISCVSKYPILPSTEETLSLSLAMAFSFVVTFSSNLVIFNPNSFIFL